MACNTCCRKLATAYPQLHLFEVCVLANLAPGDLDEAKLVVPSLVVSSFALWKSMLYITMQKNFVTSPVIVVLL